MYTCTVHTHVHHVAIWQVVHEPITVHVHVCPNLLVLTTNYQSASKVHLKPYNLHRLDV